MCLGHLSNYAVVAQSLLNMGIDDGFVPTKIQDFYVNNEGQLDPNGVLPDFLKLDPNAPEGLVVCLVEFARDEMDYDSDTDIEARVSPEYPLSSGDMIEDEEMYARIGFASDSGADRSAFTAVLCDNM